MLVANPQCMLHGAGSPAAFPAMQDRIEVESDSFEATIKIRSQREIVVETGFKSSIAALRAAGWIARRDFRN